MDNDISSNSDSEKPLNKLFMLYLKNMTPQEKIAYKIAQQNLESSYDMEKSIGFVNFLNKNNLCISK